MPEIILKVDFELVSLSRGKGHAAKILTPGPILSGFKIPGLALLGPREEKEATDGADLSPMIVPLNRIVAMGAFVEFI